jgi:beta-phosphoglucomutase-like phosphatase (HAD superfamily)
MPSPAPTGGSGQLTMPRPALAALQQRGHVIVVFSVGPRAWLEELAGSHREFVDDFVRAEEAGVYKPHPGIYRHLLGRTSTAPPAALLVSANTFDIAGAAAIGIRTACCRRQPTAPFDPRGATAGLRDHGPVRTGRRPARRVATVTTPTTRPPRFARNRRRFERVTAVGPAHVAQCPAGSE